MKKDPQILVEHILESIESIEEYVEKLTIQNFLANKQIQDSVVRRLEIIGEAVKKLPDDFKLKRKTIPWKEIAGMRDVLIHEYFGVNYLQVWNTIKKDLPNLKKKLG